MSICSSLPIQNSMLIVRLWKIGRSMFLFIRKSSTVHLRNSQLHSAKAEGLGFKDSRGQVKRPSKPFLESLDPGPLESLSQHRPLN